MLRRWSQSGWPADGFTLADNLEDLEMHYREHVERAACTYTVLTPDGAECLGAVYVKPIGPLSCLLSVSAPLRFTRLQSSYLAILVMQTTQNWEGNDINQRSNRTSCCIPRFRHVLIDALVRARPIEIPHVLVEDPPQVHFPENQHMVEAFTLDAP